MRSAMRLILAATIASAGLVSGGCSTVQDIAGIERPGVQANGGYILTSTESSMDCRALADRIDVTLEDMAKAAGRIKGERESLPPTVLGALQRTFGSSEDAGIASARKHREGEARVRALAAEQSRKGCAAADIEARIAATKPQAI